MDPHVLVLVHGATGGTGRLLVDRLLADGHQVRAFVRDPDKGAPLAKRGAEVVPGDLTDPDATALTDATRGVDAVAFCAGSGASTGKDMTLLVDLHGAVRTIDAAVEAGADRYVMLSSMAADDPLGSSEAMAPYLAAKHAADRVLAASGLRWMVVRPGALTDDPPTDQVRTGTPRIARAERGDRSISRADVAAVMAASLEADATGVTFEVLSGDRPVAEAVADLAAGSA
ncbi:MAG: SDR family oxidoreductase [Nitriliruptor sp.]|uniref:SDR family oxidoreductase n=1 Tax=Nitriliruptor sp. TaxID=2448056 RepID=UPI00349FF8F6